MKSRLLALFEFKICLTYDFNRNLRSFVVVLHDYPLKVEQTQLYSLVKKWISPEDVQEALAMHSMMCLPSARPLEETDSQMVRFFKQSYYRNKPKEEVKLLCWGMTKKQEGFFEFKLPEVVSTRFISLVATSVHSTKLDSRPDNVDIRKFLPLGAIVPCL